MRRPILHAIVVLLGIFVFDAQATESIEIEALLRELSALQTPAELTRTEACPAAGDPPPSRSLPPHLDEYLFMRQTAQLSPSACHGKLQLDDLCMETLSDCLRIDGTRNCYSYGVTLEKRFGNLPLRNRIFQFTARTFQKYIHHPDILKTCCGEHAQCRSALTATTLKIIRGLSSSDQTLYYQPEILGFGRIVKISEGALLQSRTEQNIEALILHELGHSCQQARQAIHGSSLKLGLSYLNCSSMGISKQDFLDIYGEKVTSCVFDSLAKTAASTSDSCLGSWAAEAFADTVFLAQRNDLGHYAYSCTTHTDHAHSSAKNYLPCFLELPQVKNKLCAGRSKVLESH